MRIFTLLNHGPFPALQTVEVASSLQIPSFQVVGLPSPEVAESRERIRAAIDASGLEFPRKRVVVNLSPASVKKRGTGLDLAMALAILANDAKTGDPIRVLAWGELGLDGAVKEVGQLTRALWIAWKSNIDLVLIAERDRLAARDALALIRSGEPGTPSRMRVRFVSTLAAAWSAIRSDTGETDDAALSPSPPLEPTRSPPTLLPLPPNLERAISLAAAGGHHLLLLGPKGSGKSHALDWLASLLPIPSPAITLERALVAELITDSETPVPTPVRRVSVQARPAALAGTIGLGGLRPGELALAHGGMLVADEFPEWARDTRELLREPLESKRVTLTRAEGRMDLPADFLFAGNGNLCPCGGWPTGIPLPLSALEKPANTPPCRCTPSQQTQYLRRLSGPILDRIDLVLVAQLQEPARSDAHWLQIRAKVEAARSRAIATWGVLPGSLSATELERLRDAHPEWQRDATASLSLRSRHKTLRLALTLAALDGVDRPLQRHFSEALCYRPERFGALES